jgi:hypothetical protein
MVEHPYWGMSESEFLRVYAATALRKPQVVSDNVLAGVFLADASHRLALTALLLQEAVEAARRLAGVWAALSDRSQPVAQRLGHTLPGPELWQSFAEAVASARERPAQLLQAMAIDASAMESATELTAFAGLEAFEEAVRVFASGTPSTLSDPATPSGLLVVCVDAAGHRIEARWLLADDAVIALGDATGYFVTWARDFLGAYIEAREDSGRR